MDELKLVLKSFKRGVFRGSSKWEKLCEVKHEICFLRMNCCVYSTCIYAKADVKGKCEGLCEVKSRQIMGDTQISTSNVILHEVGIYCIHRIHLQ